MVRWTAFVIAHRKRIVAVWLVLFVLGAWAAANLGDLLTNRFSVPGAESELGLELLKDRMGERSDGAFTLVATGVDTAADRAAFAAAARRAAGSVRGGKAKPAQVAGSGIVYAQISTPLENQDAAKLTPELRRAIGDVPGVRTYLSGYPAINHDTQDIFNEDLARGESIAVPVALLVLAFMFGTLGGIAVPIAFAAVTIPTTLGLVWIAAHVMEMAIYVTNIVALIGLAIAVDYSMLVVFRFREELRPHARHAHCAREDDGDGRASDAVLGDGRGDRTRTARVHASAVHALHGRRRPARAGRLDRRVGDVAPSAARDDGTWGEPFPDHPAPGDGTARSLRHDGVLASPGHGHHAPTGAVLHRFRGVDARARGAGAEPRRHGR